jgi:RNA polymerase sigma-70 factor (ECF subfamily)
MITEKDFTTIYNTHASKVHRLCLGYASGDQDLANEWLQETFIKVWNHRKSFKGEASINTWIYRIAVNTCLSDLRKTKKNVPINESILMNNAIDRNITEHELKLKKMYSCIDQLTEQNKALILLELEDLPQATIAETVGLAHGTLRTRLSRIRKSLLKCITNGK